MTNQFVWLTLRSSTPEIYHQSAWLVEMDVPPSKGKGVRDTLTAQKEARVLKMLDEWELRKEGYDDHSEAHRDIHIAGQRLGYGLPFAYIERLTPKVALKSTSSMTKWLNEISTKGEEWWQPKVGRRPRPWNTTFHLVRTPACYRMPHRYPNGHIVGRNCKECKEYQAMVKTAVDLEIL